LEIKKKNTEHSLIWEGVVRKCNSDKNSTNFLITNNTKDFFNEKNENLDANLNNEIRNIKAYKSLSIIYPNNETTH
jgi:hypothetical protein